MRQQLVGRAHGARWSLVTAAALLAQLAACGGTTEVARDVPGPLAHITVSPANATVGAGQTQKFTAVGTDAGGGVVSITPQWSVVASGGTIDATGLFTADTKAGVFANTISAKSGSITGLASLTVTPGAAATLALTPATVTLSSGATQQYAVTGKDAYGNDVTVTAAWSVVGDAGTITSTGLFTATKVGTFANAVRATVGTLTATATVTVTPGVPTTIQLAPATVTLHPTEHQQFTVTAKDAAGNDVTPTVTWSVVSGGGSIDGTGLFTAGAATGTFTNTVKATVGTLTAFATVTVNPGTVTSIVFIGIPGAGEAVSLKPGEKYQFTVQGKDAGGNVVTFTPVWSVTPESGGTIDATGLFTAGTKAGTYTITATVTSAVMAKVSTSRSGKASAGTAPGTLITASAPVRIIPGDLKLIDIRPNAVTLAPGDKQQFVVTGHDQWLNDIVIFPKWSLDNGGGAIGELGMFTAGATAGTYTVRATVSGMSSTATVTITGGGVFPLGRAASFALVFRNLVDVRGSVTHVVGDVAALGAEVWEGGAADLAPRVTGTMHVNDAVAESAFVAGSLFANALHERPCDHSVGDISLQRTWTPGKYCFSGNEVEAWDNVTLDAGGDPDAIFVFQATEVQFWSETNAGFILLNGAKADNVYWVVDYLWMWNFNAVGTFFVNDYSEITDAVIRGRLLTPGRVWLDDGLIALPGAVVPPLPGNRLPAPTALQPNRAPGPEAVRAHSPKPVAGWPFIPAPNPPR